jgi:hypothetical protein
MWFNRRAKGTLKTNESFLLWSYVMFAQSDEVSAFYTPTCEDLISTATA